MNGLCVRALKKRNSERKIDCIGFCPLEKSILYCVDISPRGRLIRSQIFVMEYRHQKAVLKTYPRAYKKGECLDIPDKHYHN